MGLWARDIPPRRQGFMKRFLFLLVIPMAFLYAGETLPVYQKENPDSKVLGLLLASDKVVELPIPPKKKKVVKYVRQKNSKKKKRVIQYVNEETKEPPEFIPVKTKFAKKGFVRRADLARFKERAKDLSGIYSSATGAVVLSKSPNFPGKFNIRIQNGSGTERAEIEVGNIPARESAGGHTRFSYAEDGCSLEVDLFERKVRVAQKGCEEYNAPGSSLSGNYETYSEYRHRAEVFRDREFSASFKKFTWCPEGPNSCERIRDEGDCTVEIVWSKDSQGMIERRCGEMVHKYRPMERMIPHKRDFFHGEKPVMLKTKRTDMAGEWMVWAYYPKASRFKMFRLGARPEIAYTEIYE